MENKTKKLYTLPEIELYATLQEVLSTSDAFDDDAFDLL